MKKYKTLLGLSLAMIMVLSVMPTNIFAESLEPQSNTNGETVTTTYTISFAKGPEATTGTMESVTLNAGDEYTLPECGFELEGHTFAGWHEEYKPETVLQPGEKMIVESSLVLMPIWNVNLADYSGVNAAIEEASKLDPTDYIDFSGVAAAVEHAKNNLDLPSSEQLAVNKLAYDILLEISQLVRVYTITLNYDKTKGGVFDCNTHEPVGDEVKMYSNDENKTCVYAKPYVGNVFIYFEEATIKNYFPTISFDPVKDHNVNIVFEAKRLGLGFDIENLDFGKVNVGYGPIGAKEVKLTNTGNIDVMIKKPTSDYFDIKLQKRNDDIEVKAGFGEYMPIWFGESATMTIAPKNDLPEGKYSETIIIDGLIFKEETPYGGRPELDDFDEVKFEYKVNFEVRKEEPKPVSKPTTVIVNTATK